MNESPSVTVEQGSVSITTNTASEADLRAEMQRDTPAAPDAAPPAVTGEVTPPAPVREANGRFARTEPTATPAELPDAAGEPAADPTETAAAQQRRHDDKQRPFDGRIGRVLGQKAAAEARAAALEAELLRYQQLAGQQHAIAANAVPAPAPNGNGHSPGEPDFDRDFANNPAYPDPYTSYQQAWASWNTKVQIAEAIALDRQARAAEARAQVFEARIAEGRTAYQDYDQRLTEADTLGLQVSSVMREAIADSPRAADIVYFLATHPEECTQLALESETTPPAAAAGVMRTHLESRLPPRTAASNGAGTAARVHVSTAKPPITPVGSSPVASDNEPGESVSLAEHSRYWNRRLKVPGTL